MAQRKSAWLTAVEETGYLKNFGQIFLSKAKKLMKEDKSVTFQSLAKKASNENYKYSVKSGALIVTDISAKKSLELQLPASKSSAV